VALRDVKPWEEGEVRTSKGTAIFCSLHHHTTFSYLDGYGTPEQHAQAAARLDMYALGLTEHGNVTSHGQLERACLKLGVKPIFGCEFYCGDIGEGASQKKNHLTVLAETPEGYRNLLHLVSEAWAKGFYYQPTVNGAMLAEHAEGLVVLSGCTGSLMATSMIGGKNIEPEDASLDRARRVAKRFKGLFGDRYYLECQAFPELESTRAINAGLAELSAELGIPLVATVDAHYTRPEEGDMQMILHNVRAGHRQTLEELDRAWGYDVPLCPLSDKDIYQRLRHTGLSKKDAEGAIRNTRVIAERCNVTLPKVTNLRYPLPPGVPDSRTLFRKWVNDGWKYRGCHALPPAERRRYIDQAKYEMALIEDKDFVDYFLHIADAVKFAKDSGIPVGPARGSAAASLVCWLMRITEVNPMLFPTLLFERFIDANRFDMPDIDLDFADSQRWRVREYLAQKYGKDRVGNIGTFTQYKGRNSLDDVQRAVYGGDWECKDAVAMVKQLLLERKLGDLRGTFTITDTEDMFPQVKAVFDRWPELRKAMLMEGNIRGFSVHAAGLVVANEPLSNFCAIYTRTDADGKTKTDENGEPMEVVSIDRIDAEYLGALKDDFLGLKTMDMIRIALDLIGMSLEDLYRVPLDDEVTIDAFRRGDVVGIFQYDGRSTAQINAGVKPDNFMEIADVNALSRPGPLHSGASSLYVDTKWGRINPTHYHPIIDRITQHTQYQVVYQEQILQIVREVGGFSWAEAARVRKIISKKRGEHEFLTMMGKFVEGAATHGIDEEDATRVFKMLATAGAYAFNAAHCISYGMLAYWTMWLKQHHTTAFYVASLIKYKDKKNRLLKRFEAKATKLLRDALNHGIDILPLDPGAEAEWSVRDETTIIPGFIQVPGIGVKTAEAILAYRAEHGIEALADWEDFIEVKGIGAKTCDLMADFADNPDPFELHALRDLIGPVRTQLRSRRGVWSTDDEGLYGMSGQRYRLPAPSHLAEDVPFEKGEDEPVTWCGVVRDIDVKDLFEIHRSRTGEDLDPDTVKRPDLYEWAVLMCQDDTEVVVVTVDRWSYPKWKELVWSINVDRDVIVVRGVKKGFQARRAIYVSHLWVIQVDDDEEEELEEDAA
jgi:DNA polymerase-3 subunit alpha